MKKRIIACLLCVFCLLSAVGCTSSAPAEAAVSETTASETMVTESPTVEATAAAEGSVSGDYLSSIGGTYVELFPELSKPEYRQIWIDAVTPLVGAENAEATTDMLLGMCMAGIYGPEATEKYAADPNSMAFDCYFLGGVQKFVMDGSIIRVWMQRARKSSPTATRPWMWKMRTAFCSIRARMKIPANSPILPSPPTPWRPPITWSSVMRKT